jgi:hypothetical protein
MLLTLLPNFIMGQTVKGKTTTEIRASFQSMLTITAASTAIVRVCLRATASVSEVVFWRSVTSFVRREGVGAEITYRKPQDVLVEFPPQVRYHPLAHVTHVVGVAVIAQTLYNGHDYEGDGDGKDLSLIV